MVSSVAEFKELQLRWHARPDAVWALEICTVLGPSGNGLPGVRLSRTICRTGVAWIGIRHSACSRCRVINSSSSPSSDDDANVRLQHADPFESSLVHPRVSLIDSLPSSGHTDNYCFLTVQLSRKQAKCSYTPDSQNG